MGSNTYGEYGMIKQTLNYSAVISTFGLGVTCTRFVARYERFNTVKQKIAVSTFLISSSFSIIIAILLYCFAKQLAIGLKEPTLYIPFKITSVVLIFNRH